MTKKTKTFTLDELKSMNEAFEQRMADARAEIAANRAELESIKADMDTATEQGNIAKYKALRAKQSDLELNIEAVEAITKKATDNHACGFSNDDVRTAWAEYVTGFNAKSAAFTAELEQLRRSLLDKYIEAARVQNEALKVRDQFIALLTKEGFSDSGRPLDLANIQALPDTHYALMVDNIDGVEERTWNWLHVVCDCHDAANCL